MLQVTSSSGASASELLMFFLHLESIAALSSTLLLSFCVRFLSLGCCLSRLNRNNENVLSTSEDRQDYIPVSLVSWMTFVRSLSQWTDGGTLGLCWWSSVGVCITPSVFVMNSSRCFPLHTSFCVWDWAEREENNLSRKQLRSSL